MKKSNFLIFTLALFLALTPAHYVQAEEIDVISESTDDNNDQDLSNDNNDQDSSNGNNDQDLSNDNNNQDSSNDNNDQDPSNDNNDQDPSNDNNTPGIDTSKYENQDVCNFVIRMYEKILNRKPDEAGLENWYNNLVANQIHAGDVVDNFISSPEFEEKDLNDDAFLNLMYETILDRPIDASGAKTWSEVLSYGVSERYICSSLVSSEEFTKLCESYKVTPGEIILTENRDQNLDVTKFMSHFYTNIFNRKGDTDGLNNWTGALLNQSITATDVTEGFIFSDEFQKKNIDTKEFLEILYQTLLGRPSDEPGMEGWLTRMNNGVSNRYATTHFIYSAEFSNLCNTYGILRGTPEVTEYRDINYEMTELVNSIYKNVLDRAASGNELNQWTEKLQKSTLTSSELADAFFLSQEYIAKNTSEADYIHDLYLALLRRQPSNSEVTGKLNDLTQLSGDRYHLLNSFSNSKEYQDHCFEIGILPLHNGWFSNQDNWYYYQNSQKYTGWLEDNDEWYYLSPSNNGAAQVGWAYIGNYKFYFDENCILVQNVDELIGPQDSYFIQVYKYGNYAIVFAQDGDNGYIIPVKAMITSCGHPTPTGYYRTQAKYRWCTMVGGSQAQWCTQIIGDYLFHSVPYRTTNNSTLYTDLMYNKLGTTQSLGCIRLQAGDAKWLFENCEVGTLVHIDPNVTEGPFDKPEFNPVPSWHTWDPTDPTAYYLCAQHGCH